MKVLFLSPDFHGHKLAIIALQDIIREHFPFIRTELILFDNSNNTSTDPKRFTVDNLERDLDTIYETLDVESVNLIIYDFFALAGRVLSDIHNIPCICSIPAVLSEHMYEESVNPAYIPAILSMYRPLPVSDGLLFPGDTNIVWTYEGLYRSLPPLQDAYFVGSKSQFQDTHHMPHMQNNIYMSLGTVVPGSVYIMSDHTVQSCIKNIYLCVIEYFRHRPEYTLTVSCPLDLEYEPAHNVTVLSYCDQLEMLHKASLFITHGGGNSINEAILANCPMLVIPFFGDQYVSARLIEERQIGLCVYPTYSDFNNSTTELNICSAEEINIILDKIIQNIDIYRMHMEYIKLYDERKLSLDKIYLCIQRYITFQHIWRPWDLLYGTTVDRQTFVSHQNMVSHFRIGEIDSSGQYLTIDKLAIIPGLIDQCNDVLRQYTVSEMRYYITNSNICDMLLQYRDYLISSGTLTAEELGSEELITKTNREQERIVAVALIKMCCAGMKFFINRGSCIHFILDTMHKDRNPGTHMELIYASQLSPAERQSIVYWRKEGNKYNIIHMIPPYMIPLNTTQVYAQVYDALSLILPQSATLQGRIKTEPSIQRKLYRDVPIDDLVGYRILYTDVVPNIILQCLSINNTVVSERGKVFHLYSVVDNVPVEVQLWPNMLYNCFEMEHDTIYKGTERSDEAISRSIAARLEAHNKC